MAAKLQFQEAMAIAARNAKQAEKKAQQTVFPVISKPKKLNPKDKKLTEGIKKFLEQKEKEEREKKLEAQAKRKHLEELRSQTKGANRRVGQMLRMTKSSNKACIDDAQSCLNDSLAAQGECQPDEDDYGYVSQSAQAMHQKLMASYKNIPASKMVRKPSAPIPESRPLSNPRAGDSSNNHSSSTREHSRKSSSHAPIHEEYVPEAKPEKVPAKRKLPPPPNFQALLVLAAEKSKEPVQLKKPVVQNKEWDGPDFQYGRPMTAKEKERFAQERVYRDRIEKGLCTISSSETNKPNSPAETPERANSFKIPNKKAKVSTQNTPPPTPKLSSSNYSSKNPDSNPGSATKMSIKMENGHQKDSRQRSEPAKERTPVGKSDNRPSEYGNSRNVTPRKDYESSSYQSKIKERDSSSYDSRVKREPDYSSYEPKIKREAHTAMDRTKSRKDFESSANGIKIKKEPDSSLYQAKVKKEPYDRPAHYSQGNQVRKENVDRAPAAKSSASSNRREENNGRNPRPGFAPKYAPQPRINRELPPNPYADPRPGGPRRPMPPKPSYKGGRAVIDSDEEYDSEMDDFIDDSEADMRTISNEISQIFNYRRDKYVDEPSDDECMESSLEQQMQEERRSLLIGIKEDKEEEMKEKAEEERKRQRLLAQKKAMRR